MAYLDLPIETDADALKDDAVDYLTSSIPGWTAAAGNLETILIEAIAEMAAEQAEVASEVPSAIFRKFGEALVGLAPIDGVEAVGSTSWTLNDTLGHTIPAGTFITISEIPFQTSQETTVAVGVSSASIPIVAVDPGEQGNDLTGPAELVDTLAYVSDVEVTGVTAGGVDAETDDEYLDRLTDELTLMAPRPIVPQDFEILSRRIAGVDRALAVDLWNPAAASSGVTGNVTSGSKSVTTIAGATMDSSYIGAAITGPNIPAGTYVVATPSGTTLTMSKAATGTNGGNALTLTGRGNVERMVSIAAVDEDGEAVSAGVKTAIDDYLEARREVNFVVNVIDPTYTTIAVTVDVSILPGFDAATVKDVIAGALNDFLDPANWGRVSSGDGTADRPWINTKIVGYLNVARTILLVEGVAFINSLTINDGTGAVSADVALGGPAPLTRPGTITVTGS